MTDFTTHELVCPHAYKKFGDRAMMFADPRLIEWINWFRDIINRPVSVNDYYWSGKFTQRGYRCNLCPLVAAKTRADEMYLSAHTRFQAVDFHVRDMGEDEVRAFIERHKKDMPHPIRIEKDTVGWVHVDMCNDSITNEKIIYFNGL